jgi:hypothetical protein
MLQLPNASPRSVASLSNWVNATGSIVRKETAFLQNRDLCAVGAEERYGIAWMESLIGRIFIYFQQVSTQAYLPKLFPRRSSASAVGTRGSRVFVFDGHTLHVISITTLILLLMLIPVFVMQATSSAALRLVCVMLMSILFTGVMSSPMNAPPAEIFGASATYKMPAVHWSSCG